MAGSRETRTGTITLRGTVGRGKQKGATQESRHASAKAGALHLCLNSNLSGYSSIYRCLTLPFFHHRIIPPNRSPPPALRASMKFLLKVAVLAAAAKFVLHTPRGTYPDLDRVSEFSVRDMAHSVDTVFAKIEETIKSLFS